MSTEEMKNDNRTKNTYFDNYTIGSYIHEYAMTIKDGLKSIDQVELHRTMEILKSKKNIYVGGNGGSSAIADHLKCDMENGANIPIHSLNGSMATFSAIANDSGYENTLLIQLQMHDFSATDALILISSSGNSPNIIKAAEYAISKGGEVIGLTGFDGGKLKEMANACLHINFRNYGIVEDCHQALMHIIAQYLYLESK